MKRLVILSVFVLIFTSALFAGNGLVKVKSTHNVHATVDSLVKVLKSKGMTVFAVIDHQKGAESVGKKIRPTTVVIFGNPKIGTLLMQCNQTVAIDLPQKMLIWEDSSGQTWIAYNNPDYLVERHKLNDCNKKIVAKIKGALKKFAETAAK